METILIVDDEPAIREIFAAYLGMGGYRAIAVPGGSECLDLLKTEIPDLVLLDLMMEPMDGWETLLAIRANPSSLNVPVIIITGKPPVPEEILQYGGLIEDFIVKPVDFKKFTASLHRILERDRDFGREINRMKKSGQDPELLAEYAHILRFARVAHNLEKRMTGRPWAGGIPLQKQKEQLHRLHEKLGFPDRFLEPDEGI
jgi:two-component system OmpR family response regulator